jgi:ABC-type transport system involved in multi-copper enzyme maturation permease subunit
MIRLAHVELYKLRTVRAPSWVLTAVVLLVVMGISGFIATADRLGTDLTAPDSLRTALAHGGITAVVSLALGVMISAGEFRQATAADTFLTEPRRSRVIGSKLLAGAAVGLLAGVLAALAATVTASAWYAAKGIELDLGSATVLRSVVGIIVWQTLYTVIGVALGAMIRSQTAAISAAVVWLMIVEAAIAGLLVSVGRWLPATAARALGNQPGTDLLPQVGGGAVLLAWTAVAAIGALVVTARRDLV